MPLDVTTNILSQGLLGSLLIIAGLVIRYLFNGWMAAQERERQTYRDSSIANLEMVSTMKRAIDLLEASKHS